VEPALSAFVRAAEDFDAWVTQAAALPIDTWAGLQSLRAVLAPLYLAGVRLEWVDPGDSSDVDRHVDITETWPLMGLLQRWQKAAHRNVEVDRLWLTIGDDVQDIWRDVREGLCEYQEGRPNAAVSTWRINFDIHWGRHAASALLAIESLLCTI
jgi:Domain of unknown function (DUF5063)